MGKTKEKPAPSATVAVRVKPKTATVMLDCSTSHLWELSTQDIFTPIYPNGRGKGKKPFYLADEIRLYAESGEDGAEVVRAYRRKMGRLKK